MENFDLKNANLIVKNSVKIHFAYKGHYFITYSYKNELYFDIQHLISVLNLKQSSRNAKYNDYCNEIVYYKWHQNQYSGYILRELVNEKTMYDIVLSSNSVFTKKFKKDVAEILVELRRTNKLQLTNDKLQLRKKAYKN